MITDERLEAFFGSLRAAKTPFLEDLEREALADGVPIIRPQAQSLLRYVIASAKPHSILEIGTAIGFSAIFMATYGDDDLHIDTIENYDKHIVRAYTNIREAGFEDRIDLIEGDAMTVLEDLVSKGRSYDMIFMDAAKAQYLNYLPLCKSMLLQGGILVSDNVLFDGDIVQSRFAVRRRDRTIHSRMREFLRVISEDKDLITTILPVGDGMTLSVMNDPKSVKSGSEDEK